MKYTLWLNQIDKEDKDLVGGKSANLGEIKRAGAPVPNGFALTSEAYWEFLRTNNLGDQLRDIFTKIDFKNLDLVNEISYHLKNLIKTADFPEKITSQIKSSHDRLKLKREYIAVRSSATVEDTAETSFAGQLESYLNLKGLDEIVLSIKKCWASLYEPRSMFYFKEQGIDQSKVGVAVMIQEMIESDTSGVMFTIDPVTNNKSRIVIEAVFGLGSLIVKGEVTPDHYEVTKRNFTIISREIGTQNKQLILTKSKNKEIPVSNAYKSSQKISDEKIITLAKLGKKLEDIYLYPQDIEWAIENDKLFILQSRPVTSFFTKEVTKSKKSTIDLPILVEGTPASPGITQGFARNLSSPKEIKKMKKGDILILPLSNQNYIPALKIASAVVTDKGGETSHAAIVSREVGIPCVVGTGTATSRIKSGSVITVNGSLGTVYEGSLPYSKIRIIKSSFGETEGKKINGDNLKTATKVLVNLVDSSVAADVSQKNIDGVGLLRAEFIISELGTHPKKLINEGKSNLFIQKLVDALKVTCASFEPRQVVYRSLDFTSNEYLHLTGGEKYEQEETHPLLGYRGAIRNINDPAIFNLELEAIRLVRGKFGMKNLSLMVPFVRSVDELAYVKRAVAAAGLHRSISFKLIMSVEIPSNVVLIDRYLDVGIDGVAIDLADLTSFMLSVDRSNEKVFDFYNESDPALLWSLAHVIKACSKRKVHSSVIGQASLLNKKIIETLVHSGVNAVSVSPDMISQTKILISSVEKDLVRSRKKSS